MQLTNTIKITSLLNRASYFQLVLIGFISIIYLVIYKDYLVFTGLIISGIASSSYTQLIKLGYFNKIFALWGFPIRLLVIVPPCAILIHKLHSNLIALFIGFALCQIIYFIHIWSYAKNQF